MINSLLLYNNNISPDFINEFHTSLGETKYFSITNQTLAKEDYSFDSVVSEFLMTLNDKKYDVIFIPVNLSTDNYLEFSGLRIGYHIRLTNGFKNQETTIVFIATETSYEINKLSNLGEILSCPQIFMTDKLEIDVLRKQIDFIESTPKENILKGFLDRIHMKPSGNYTTHHSIANEWSIMRWYKTLFTSNIIKNTANELDSIESKIKTNIYYKYLACKYNVVKVQELTNRDLKLKFNGKILYIDDEKDKGWHELFSVLLDNTLTNKVEKFESFGSEFFQYGKDDIVSQSVSKAKDFDLVILDFRLTEDDYYETLPKNITGYKILEGIKTINQGIQVVIFSATNKVWNLQALQDVGADGFIIKESPENSADRNFTYESLKNLTSTINLCLYRSSYLKKIFEVISDIKIYFNSNQNLVFDEESNQMVQYYSEYQLDVMNQLEIAFFLLDRTNVNDNIKKTNQNLINHAFTSLYKILEYFFVEEIKEKIKLQTYDNNLKKFVPFNDKKHSELQSGVITFLSFKLKLDPYTNNLKLKDFRDKRNGVTHPKGIKPNEKDCQNLIVFIKSLITKI
jgi:CheY-like chemotaxis protein